MKNSYSGVDTVRMQHLKIPSKLAWAQPINKSKKNRSRKITTRYRRNKL